MKVITFFNNKGGVGKTTTIINLASFLSIEKQKNVLVVDLDPQSNTTQAILPEEAWLEFYDPQIVSRRSTIYDYFKDMEEGDANFIDISVPVSSSENEYKVSLIPGHPKLSIIDDTMSKSWSETQSGDKGAIRKLNWLNQLKKNNDQFDYIFIDVGPSLGALNRSALLNSDFFLTPMASDIFSLLGISNIGDWIERWMRLYTSSIENFGNLYGDKESKEFFEKYSINVNVNKTTRYIGYSIQQYSKRKFKSGERPTKAYENVIKNFHSEIEKSLGKFVKNGIPFDKLKLGDIPYVYSIIPLSQTANVPIFELTYSSGLRGNQSSSVDNYKIYLGAIADNFMKNIGDTNE
jgi:cellulose biosynthesis protein BcsQ